MLCICGNSRTKDSGVSFHCFPSKRTNLERRAVWLRSLLLPSLGCFFQEVGALIPLRSSHQCKSGIVCLSKGSQRSAPGISAGDSVTSTSASAIRAIAHMEIDVSRERFGLFTRVKAPRVWPGLKFSPGLG